MTSSRYALARFAQAFGYFRRAQRMADAASEMHLLREAEAHLGAAIWEQVEGIEALSVEYWNLRKLVKERDAAADKLAACQARLDKAHEERANLLNQVPEEQQELNDERVELLKKLETLAIERDKVIVQAREVRRAYTGLKTKLEVLLNETEGTPTTTGEVTEVRARLLELKERFSQLKQERIRVGEAIQKGDLEIDKVDAKIDAHRKKLRLKASESFQMIGEGNKETSSLRAESALIDTQMRQLYADIGRHVSRQAANDPACAAACASHRNLVQVMRALRYSVALNHKLAGQA